MESEHNRVTTPQGRWQRFRCLRKGCCRLFMSVRSQAAAAAPRNAAALSRNIVCLPVSMPIRQAVFQFCLGDLEHAKKTCRRTKVLVVGSVVLV